MSFPLGKPIVVMAVLAVVGGGWVMLRPEPRAADQTLWVFAQPHAEGCRRLRAGYEALEVLHRLAPDLKRVMGDDFAAFDAEADAIERSARAVAADAALDSALLAPRSVANEADSQVEAVMRERWAAIHRAAGRAASRGSSADDPATRWLAEIRAANRAAEAGLFPVGAALSSAAPMSPASAADAAAAQRQAITLSNEAIAVLRLGAMTLAVSAVRGPARQPAVDRLAAARAEVDAVLRSAGDGRGDEVGCFDPDRANPYRSTLAIHLIPSRALDIRLVSLLMAGGKGGAAPDAVEIGMGSIGRFFQPPVEQVGFLPLNDYLSGGGFREIDSLDAAGQRGQTARLVVDGRLYTHDGAGWRHNAARNRPDAWIDRILPARLAPWTKAGRIFGAPRDVHPVTLSYRDDLFREAGIDLAAPDPGKDYLTWGEFHRRCLAFQRYWADRGMRQRHAMDLFESGADLLVALLLQRGVNLIDGADGVHIADPKVAETTAFYARLIAGSERIGVESSTAGQGAWLRDLAEGNVCALFTPDWQAEALRETAPFLAGKLRMMPLPRFDPDDPPTTTWGGTMVGIPRSCPDPDAAWRMIEILYLSDAALDARVRDSGVIPPLPEHWGRSVYEIPDPLYGGQRTRRLYADLAPRIPPQIVTPNAPFARVALGLALGRATRFLKAGGDPTRLEAVLQPALEEARDELQWRIRFARFPEEAATP